MLVAVLVAGFWLYVLGLATGLLCSELKEEDE